MATISCTYGQRDALIVIGPNYWDLEPEGQRYYIVHELIHCHWAPVDSMIGHDLGDLLGSQSARLFSANYERNMEYAIDSIADAFAMKLPLPKIPSR